MNEFLGGLARFVVRAALLLAGLLFFLSLLAASLVLALLWGLRVLWARLTGQPVVPRGAWMDPRSGWRTVVTSSRWAAGRAPAGPGAPDASADSSPRSRLAPGRGSAEVTDVTPRELP